MCDSYLEVRKKTVKTLPWMERSMMGGDGEDASPELLLRWMKEVEHRGIALVHERQGKWVREVRKT